MSLMLELMSYNVGHKDFKVLWAFIILSFLDFFSNIGSLASLPVNCCTGTECNATARAIIPPYLWKCIYLTNLCDKMFFYYCPNWQTGILKKSVQNTNILLPTKFFVNLAIKSEECYCGQFAHSRCWWSINRTPVQYQEATLRIPISDSLFPLWPFDLHTT